ncbi:DNA-binding transcriptional MerR regulator [Falsibacillus pallidus]|uniref:DNA-binding transcriptional MerR regulator n=1 Tax=Falsibacillus pallidus TaxID=493781 RepID=A0A370GJ23_9BACI|nr:DNA-binding transcriptional MerR regulator [Falsibacillus pallidus]
MEHSISELAREFDVTTRTLRYYEELHLLNPMRSETGTRIYTRKDYIRTKLILRGKRYGFNLEEIKEMIQLFDKDRSGRTQLERTIAYGEEKIQEIHSRMEELQEMKEEMEELVEAFKNKLG